MYVQSLIANFDRASTNFSVEEALAPHVGEIIAIDNSCGMVKQYIAIVAKARDLKCKMRAVHGDLITHALTGENDGPGAP